MNRANPDPNPIPNPNLKVLLQQEDRPAKVSQRGRVTPHWTGLLDMAAGKVFRKVSTSEPE